MKEVFSLPVAESWLTLVGKRLQHIMITSLNNLNSPVLNLFDLFKDHVLLKFVEDLDFNHLMKLCDLSVQQFEEIYKTYSSVVRVTTSEKVTPLPFLALDASQHLKEFCSRTKGTNQFLCSFDLDNLENFFELAVVFDLVFLSNDTNLSEGIFNLSIREYETLLIFMAPINRLLIDTDNDLATPEGNRQMVRDFYDGFVESESDLKAQLSRLREFLQMFLSIKTQGLKVGLSFASGKPLSNPEEWDKFMIAYKSSCHEAIHFLFGDSKRFQSSIRSFSAVMNPTVLQKLNTIDNARFSEAIEAAKSELRYDPRYYEDYNAIYRKMLVSGLGNLFKKVVDPTFEVPKWENYDGLDIPANYLRQFIKERKSVLYSPSFMDTDIRVSLFKIWAGTQRMLNSKFVSGCEKFTNMSDAATCGFNKLLGDPELGLSETVINDWHNAFTILASLSASTENMKSVDQADKDLLVVETIVHKPTTLPNNDIHENVSTGGEGSQQMDNEKASVPVQEPSGSTDDEGTTEVAVDQGEIKVGSVKPADKTNGKTMAREIVPTKTADLKKTKLQRHAQRHENIGEDSSMSGDSLSHEDAVAVA